MDPMQELFQHVTPVPLGSQVTVATSSNPENPKMVQVLFMTVHGPMVFMLDQQHAEVLGQNLLRNAQEIEHGTLQIAREVPPLPPNGRFPGA